MNFPKVWRRLGIGIGVVLLYGWAIQGLKLNWDLLRSWPYLVSFVGSLFPPNLGVLDVAVRALIETVQMSLIGTTLGAILSIPLAIASAGNLAPKRVRWGANLIQNMVRSVPSIVLGLFFVAATGLGAAAGTLAVGVYTVGYLAKFYQTEIEGVDGRSLEALRVTGASWIQIAQYGVLPQVLPLGVGYTLYMFEYNIRAASVLGVLGSGGIGFELVNYIRGFEYSKAMTMMLVLLAVVTAIDILSQRFRKYLEAPGDVQL